MLYAFFFFFLKSTQHQQHQKAAWLSGLSLWGIDEAGLIRNECKHRPDPQLFYGSRQIYKTTEQCQFTPTENLSCNLSLARWVQLGAQYFSLCLLSPVKTILHNLTPPTLAGFTIFKTVLAWNSSTLDTALTWTWGMTCRRLDKTTLSKARDK